MLKFLFFLVINICTIFIVFCLTILLISIYSYARYGYYDYLYIAENIRVMALTVFLFSLVAFGRIGKPFLVKVSLLLNFVSGVFATFIFSFFIRIALVEDSKITILGVASVDYALSMVILFIVFFSLFYFLLREKGDRSG